MNLIADILLAGGAFGVAVYCMVLSRRLARFTDLERGVGGAVSVLSTQVDDLTRALESAHRSAEGSGQTLRDLTARAEDVSRRLELHVASLHDLEPAPAPRPEPAPTPPPAPAPEPAPRTSPAPEPAPAPEPVPAPAAAARPEVRAPWPMASRPHATAPQAPARLAGNPLAAVR